MTMIPFEEWTTCEARVAIADNELWILNFDFKKGGPHKKHDVSLVHH
jgi:hypothetical protein